MPFDPARSQRTAAIHYFNVVFKEMAKNADNSSVYLYLFVAEASGGKRPQKAIDQK
jgi:hypothetical protein